MLVFDVDGDGAKACGAEDGFEGFWRRVVEAIVLDVFLHFFAESRMVVDLGDEQEGAAFFEDAADFLEVLGRVGPEVEALDGRDLVEGVVIERQGLDGALADVHLAGGDVCGIRPARGLDGGLA